MRRAFLCGTIVIGTIASVGFECQTPPANSRPPAARKEATQAKPQTRPHGERIDVPPQLVHVDDGDTATIHWSGDDVETVRILGIDSPETRHVEHSIPYDQSFGPEARAFAMGAFAAATKVELLRCGTVDPYDRTLGYLFINGKNYSVLIIKAGLAAETVNHYGDNGLPREASEVLAATKEVGPPPFEPPHVFRGRMRRVSDWQKSHGEPHR